MSKEILNKEILNKEILSVKELAEYTGLGVTTIYALVREKSIPFGKVGGRILFLKDEIYQWLKNGQ